jgi:hypothetical protein
MFFMISILMLMMLKLLIPADNWNGFRHIYENTFNIYFPT